MAVVAASATRRSGVIAALPLRAGGGVLLRGLASALLDDFCMLQLNAATQNKSCLWACELSLSKQHCWHESYALQALINAHHCELTCADAKFCKSNLASSKTLGSFQALFLSSRGQSAANFVIPLPFLKHTHGYRKPRERYAPQGEFSQEETRPSSPVIVPARGAKWAFEEIYGRLAALQAAGAAPIIKAWLAGELPLTFP